MVSRSLAFVFLALACACSRSTSLAGFEGEITLETRTASSAVAETLKLGVKGDKLRFDVPRSSGGYALYDAAKHEVLFVAPAQKSYFRPDFQAAAAAPNTDPGQASAAKTGARATIAGVECEEWRVSDPSGARSEVCIAEGLAYFDPASLRGGPADTSPIGRQFRDKRSFPLRSVEYAADGTERSRSEVTKIERKALAAEAFAVPPEFSLVAVPPAK